MQTIRTGPQNTLQIHYMLQTCTHLQGTTRYHCKNTLAVSDLTRGTEMIGYRKCIQDLQF